LSGIEPVLEKTAPITTLEVNPYFQLFPVRCLVHYGRCFSGKSTPVLDWHVETDINVARKPEGCPPGTGW